MRNKLRQTIVNLSCRIYGNVLPLYPFALRSHFGPDMADVFEQHIRDQCIRSGLAGAARVWFDIAGEVIKVAATRDFLWQRLVISVFSLAASLVFFLGFFWANRMLK